MQQFNVAYIVIVSVLLANVASADDFEFIVLTDSRNLPDPASRPDVTHERMLAQEASLERRSDARREILKVLRRTKSDMQLAGYSIASEGQVSAYDSYKTDARISLPLDSISFGYEPARLTGPAFANGRLVGLNGSQESDGRVHEVAYVFEFEDLGLVVVEELSYATIPDAKITVTKPIGNMFINGFAASYTALTNESRTKGLTAISFITDDKMFTVTALKTIPASEKEQLGRLVEIASALY